MLKKRVLGRTGLNVSEISFGAWQIGGIGYGPVPEKEAVAAVAEYLGQGGNFIDTARRYGESERILGDCFQREGGREHLILASKTPENEEAGMRRDLEETLRLLRSGYVDLYYLHNPPDDPDAMNRALDVCEKFRAEGKIRAVGASIKGPDVTQATVDLCRQYIRTGRVDTLMVIYSIFRQKNTQIFQEAVDSGVGIVARAVLESGFLTGCYAPGHQFAEGDHRLRWGSCLNRILEEAQALGQQAVVPPYENLTQVAVQFALNPAGVSSVVAGARTARQIRGSIEAAALPPLSAALHGQLVRAYSGRDEEFNTGM